MRNFFGILAALSLMLLLVSCSEKTDTNAPAPGSVVVPGSDDEFAPLITSSSASGCTRTINYWRNHSDDPIWSQLRHGPNTMFAGTGKTYLQVARLSETGLGTYYILGRQFIAAKLNVRSGASIPREILQAGTHAVELLRDYDGNPHRMNAIRGSVRADFLRTAAVLWSYNIGLVGPGCCIGQEGADAFPVLEDAEVDDVK